jgi:hypothetical protein
MRVGVDLIVQFTAAATTTANQFVIYKITILNQCDGGGDKTTAL